MGEARASMAGGATTADGQDASYGQVVKPGQDGAVTRDSAGHVPDDQHACESIQNRGSSALCVEANGRLEQIRRWYLGQSLGWGGVGYHASRSQIGNRLFCSRINFLPFKLGGLAPRKLRESQNRGVLTGLG